MADRPARDAKTDRSAKRQCGGDAAPRDPARRDRAGRGELLLLIVVVGFGLILRTAFLSRAAVEHFDEGVYASGVWFDETYAHQYPRLHLYGPPLIPWLAKAALVCEYMLREGSGVASASWTPILPPLAGACLMPLAVWWIARRWFGIAPAMGAAVFCAFSDLHAAYSRAVLTDALMALFFLLSVWLIQKAIAGWSWRAAAAAGCMTAATWWTKYNGWLPLAIGLGATLLAAVIQRPPLRESRDRVARWCAVAAIAALAWSPVLILLQPFGGYAQVAANHRNYLVGLSRWLDTAGHQHANLCFFDGAVTICGFLAASAVVAFPRIGGLERKHRRSACVGVGALAISLAAIAALLGSDAVLLILALTGVSDRVRSSVARRGHDDDWPAADWFLAVWFLGLFALTPMYVAYPRLVLPWLTSAWLGAGVGLDRLIAVLVGVEVRSAATKRMWAYSIIMGIAGGTLLSCGSEIGMRRVPAWCDRTGMKQVAAGIRADLEAYAGREGISPDEVLVCVYGEPALFYQLRAGGMQHVLPVVEIPGAQDRREAAIKAVVLVSGPHARRTPEFQRDWPRQQARFDRLNRYAFWPSDLLLLDQHDPRVDLRNRRIRDEVVLDVMK
jgi:4-amino-4-deoxy-L-arabinose transferase-like glycosyltransferase